MFRYSGFHWDSDLLISSDADIHHTKISSAFKRVEEKITVTKTDTGVRTSIKCGNRSLSVKDMLEDSKLTASQLAEFVRYESDVLVDYTGVIKGYMIKVLSQVLEEGGAKKYFINFGGDILSKGMNTAINISEKIVAHLSGTFCCFTSNSLKRSDHIKLSDSNSNVKKYDSVTIIIRDNDPVYADYLATSTYSKGTVLTNSKKVQTIFTKNGLLTNVDQVVYPAAPWFNKYEEKVKKSMMAPLNLDLVLDPRNTEASRMYDVSPGTELAKTISKDNIRFIKGCDYLIFPVNTDDLGTIFDMAYALSNNKPIFSYDDKTGKYTLVDNKLIIKELPKLNKEEKCVIYLNSRSDAVILGYYFGKGHNNLYYSTELKDNVMLSANFIRVELSDKYKNRYRVVRANYKEIR